MSVQNFARLDLDDNKDLAGLPRPLVGCRKGTAEVLPGMTSFGHAGKLGKAAAHEELGFCILNLVHLHLECPYGHTSS